MPDGLKAYHSHALTGNHFPEIHRNTRHSGVNNATNICCHCQLELIRACLKHFVESLPQGCFHHQLLSINYHLVGTANLQTLSILSNSMFDEALWNFVLAMI